MDVKEATKEVSTEVSPVECSAQNQAKTDEAEHTFEEDYARSSKAIFKEHAQHETFYKVLLIVSQGDDEKEICDKIRALPEMKVTLRTPRYYLQTLYGTGALHREPIEQEQAVAESPAPVADQAEAATQTATACGAAADPSATTTTEATAPASATEAAATPAAQPAADAENAQPTAPAKPTIEHYRWTLSPVGAQLLLDLAPTGRLKTLLAKDEKMLPIYTSILDFCTTPRKRMEIEKYLGDKHALEGLNVFTSFFLDELEQNGGIVWKDAWVTTPDGKEILEEESGREKGE